MASLTRWTWVWASSESWWWTGKPGMLQSMGSRRVGPDWATELNLRTSFLPQASSLQVSSQIWSGFRALPTSPYWIEKILFKKQRQDFPSALVVKTPCFQCRGHSLIPGQGSSTCCVVWQKKKKAKAGDILVISVHLYWRLMCNSHSLAFKNTWNSSYLLKIQILKEFRLGTTDSVKLFTFFKN